MKKVNLIPEIGAFIDAVEKNTTTPLYELSYEAAREVLRGAQKTAVEMAAADIVDMKIPVYDKHEIALRIVRPAGEAGTGTLPVVFYIHGGGWVMGDADTHERLIRELAVGSGAAVVFPVYTPSPEARYPQPLNELYGALEYVIKNAEKLDFDISRLVVAGDSVGGNMATALALMAKERKLSAKIKLQLLFYPVTDDNFDNESYLKFQDGPWLSREAMKWFWNAYAPDEKSREEIYACPLKASVKELKGLPEALIITDENDVLRDEGEEYGRKLAEAGVKTAVVRFNGTIHDFAMLNAISATEPTRMAILLAVQKLKEVCGA